MNPSRRPSFTWLLAAMAAACATTGDEASVPEGLPTAGAGPFRRLTEAEVPGIAPFVLDSKPALYREPAAFHGPEGTVLYAIARDGDADVVVRSRAVDGRSFFGTSADFGRKPTVVLRADAAWEGSALSGPAVLHASGETYLYYAAEGGIGLARSSDGFVFGKEPAPVLASDPAPSWEAEPPRAPSVFVLPDGRFRMFYESAGAIGEAESRDGFAWQRIDPDSATPEREPVLERSPPPAPGSLLPHEKPPFDTVSVGDPCALLRTTPAGRLHVRVLYTGRSGDGASAIGFAARYGESGRLVRNAAPVYAVNQHEAAPAFVEVGARSFLYVHQDRRADTSTVYPAIAGAFSPANEALPMAAPFPDAP